MKSVFVDTYKGKKKIQCAELLLILFDYATLNQNNLLTYLM